MKLFGFYILTDAGLKAELKNRSDFDEKQVSVLLRDNLRLRGIIANLQNRYRKYLKRA